MENDIDTLPLYQVLAETVLKAIDALVTELNYDVPDPGQQGAFGSLYVGIQRFEDDGKDYSSMQAFFEPSSAGEIDNEPVPDRFAQVYNINMTVAAFHRLVIALRAIGKCVRANHPAIESPTTGRVDIYGC